MLNWAISIPSGWVAQRIALVEGDPVSNQGGWCPDALHG
jgi:hypothetical protein